MLAMMSHSKKVSKIQSSWHFNQKYKDKSIFFFHLPPCEEAQKRSCLDRGEKHWHIDPIEMNKPHTVKFRELLRMVKSTYSATIMTQANTFLNLD